MNTTSMRERFNEKFTYASFTWNGDNATGVKFAKNTKKKILDFIEQELKKEREEHKAELEMIKGEIEKEKNMYRNEFTKHEWREVDNDYNQGLKDAISILDSHINKLSTE